MKLKPIGQTDLKVTEISFGCASIGNLYHQVSDVDSAAVLECAWNNGIRYFDTAPHYGRGRSEERLGNFLDGRGRDTYVISTKVGRLLSPGVKRDAIDGFIDPLPNDVQYDYSGDGVEAAFEQSCERLGTSRIDILFVHDLGVYTHGEDKNARHMDDFLGSGIERLRKLKAAGRISAYGLGVNENQVCLDVMKHDPIDVILLAGRLTLLDRSAEDELVGRCDEVGTSLVLGGIFNSGILALGPIEGATYDYGPAPQDILEKVRILQNNSEALGVPLATAALHFALRHRLAASVLFGTAKVSSLERNLEAANTTLPAGIEALF